MDTFLSRQEVQELTGFKSARRICKHLEEQGIKFFQDRAGWPLVSREFLSKFHLGGTVDESSYSPFDTEPDLSAIS